MKNKLYYILFSLIVCFSFVNNVFASEVVVSTNVENDTVVKGTEASIMVNLKSDIPLTACLFKIVSDDSIESLSKTGANGWNVTQDGGVDGFLVENSSISGDNLVSGKNILKLSPIVNANSTITIKTEYCINGTTEEQVKNIADVSVDLKVTEPVDDTTLSSLTVTGGQLTPSFSSTNLKYIIELNSPNFGLTMTASNPDYQDKIVVKDENENVITDLSNITFSDPSGKQSMPLTITVNGKTVYSIAVMYSQKELDNTLESIKINGEELTLIDGEVNYRYTVGKDVTQVEIEPTLKDSENFKFGSKSNFSGVMSITDVAYILIVVEPKKSDSGAEQLTYTIEIVREKDSSSSNNNSGSTGSSSGNNNGNSSSGNVNSNPTTGDISMFIMAFILIASLVGSIILYQKNLESFK